MVNVFMNECKHVGVHPLYWFPHKKGDCEQSFNSFDKFGGWAKPTKKYLTCSIKITFKK